MATSLLGYIIQKNKNQEDGKKQRMREEVEHEEHEYVDENVYMKHKTIPTK